MVLMDEFAELLWNSGPIVMQAQNSPSNNNTNTNTDYRHKGSTGTASYDDTLIRSSTLEETKRMKMMMDAVPKILQFGSPEPMPAPDFFSLSGIPPTCHRDGDHVRKNDAETDTHTVPGVDYPILGASDHCLDGELLTNLNPNSLLPLPHSKPLDMQVAVPVHKSGQEETLACNKQPTHLPLHRGEVGSGLINFSHFSRPIALAKASLQSAERLRSNEKASTSCNNNAPLESMVIMPSSASRPAPQPPLLPQPNLLGSCLRILNSHRFCDNKNNVPPPSSKPAQAPQRNQLLEEDKEKDKCAQPMLATSSVCSRNVDPTQLKRKTLEEDSSTHPEDAEDESDELKRLNISNSTGPKRSRTAEVHNLSERRRRDRINEKMRALQELIPNCNKVDKASMLDEAIEYLKTLQVQVQMMMMGTGMFMPPIMLPPGLHHMPVASYPQIQIGMGMGQSMGMGMGYGLGWFMDFNPSPVHAGLTLAPAAPLLPSLPQAGHIPLNFMPLINGSVFPFDNKIPSTPSFRPQHVGPSSDYKANISPMSSQFEVAVQDEKRHADTSGEVGVSPTDTTNSETEKSLTSWC